MIYSINNIRKESLKYNPVVYSRVIDADKQNTHILRNSISVELTNGDVLDIPNEFTWNRASVPQLLQGIIRADGEDDIAYLIHDFLYKNKPYSRKFSDREMLRWAKAMRQTKKISLQNIDIRIRYYVVRWFGWTVWNKKP